MRARTVREDEPGPLPRNLRCLDSAARALLGRGRPGLVWSKPWDKVLDPSLGQYGRWFVGAECNTAY